MGEHSIDLLDPALYDGDPGPTYAWLRANDPVHRDVHNGLWGITRHADIVAIERDTATFSSAGGTRPAMTHELTTESMIDCDNPRHAEQKALVSQRFTRKSVAELEAHTRARVDELIDGFARRGTADLVTELAAPLPASIICEFLGFPEDMWETLRHWGDLVNNLGDSPRFHTLEKIDALMQWKAYGAGILAERKAQPTGDLMSVLTQATIPSTGCPYSDEGLVDETLLILVGGSDTTRSSIATAVYELSRNRDQWDLLRAEPDRLPVAVEEIVRWTTPVLNMCRTATRDVELHGKQIKAGEKLLLMYGAANRDESVFAEPDRFDITRWPNPHIAFGFGPHLCLGINLAKMEIRVALEQLLTRLPDVRVPDDVVPGYNHTAFVRGYEALPVVFTPER
jgi:cholest-4-en-3-one 26-monooxygenase